MADLRTPPLVVHRTADYRGVTSPLMRDGVALSGLLISAAGAAGLSAVEPPLVRELPRDGFALILLLNLGHMIVHTIPERETLLLDLLVPAGRDAEKAVDVFTRKLGVGETRRGRLDRG